MHLSDQRALALGAVRSQLRAMNIDPVTASARDAHAVLDEMARQEPDLVASQWYRSASSRQMDLFYHDWETWRQEFLNWATQVSWVAPGSEGPNW